MTVADATPPSGTDPLTVAIFVLGAIITGGGLQLVYQIYQRRQRGKHEDAELVSRVSAQVMEGAKGLLDEYRIQLEVANRQLDHYMEQMGELNRLLGEANARIARLEHELDLTSGERAELRKELSEALSRRDRLLHEMEELRRRISELEAGLGARGG